MTDIFKGRKIKKAIYSFMYDDTIPMYVYPEGIGGLLGTEFTYEYIMELIINDKKRNV